MQGGPKVRHADDGIILNFKKNLQETMGLDHMCNMLKIQKKHILVIKAVIGFLNIYFTITTPMFYLSS